MACQAPHNTSLLRLPTAPPTSLPSCDSQAINGIMLSLQDLLVDKLCRQDYTLVADVLHLGCFEKAAAGRDRERVRFFVGVNEHVLAAKAEEVNPTAKPHTLCALSPSAHLFCTHYTPALLSTH